MSHYRAFIVSLVAFMLCIGSASAKDPVTPKTLVPHVLVSLGSFDRDAVLQPTGFGMEEVVYTVDQKNGDMSLVDSSALPRLCSGDREITDNCVHKIRINITTKKKYKAVYLRYLRGGVEPDVILLDGKKMGHFKKYGYRPSGEVSGDEGSWQEVGFNLGWMGKIGKKYSIVIHCPPGEWGDGIHGVGGIEVVGMAKPNKKKK